MQLDRWDSYRYIPDTREPLEITVTEHRALLKGETLVLEPSDVRKFGGEVTIDDGPFIILPDPDYIPLDGKVFDLETQPVMRHGEGHEGQQGVKGQQGGSAKGYSHKGGAAKGEKRKGGGRGISAGITPAREGKSERLVSAQAEKLGERFSKMEGVTVNEFGDGTGAWEGGSESIIILNYEGNGEALSALQDRAKAWNQDSVMVYGDSLEVGQDGSVVTWTLKGPIKAADRATAEKALSGAGGGGWTWQGTSQNPVLTFVQTPEFNISPTQYASIVGKMNEHFGDLVTALDRETKVAVGWRDGGYEWH